MLYGSVIITIIFSILNNTLKSEEYVQLADGFFLIAFMVVINCSYRCGGIINTNINLRHNAINLTLL